VEVTVFSPSLHEYREAPARETTSGYEIRRLYVPRFDEQGLLLFSIRVGWWLLTRSRWDVLHVHGYGNFAVFPSIIARLRGRPTLVKTTLSSSRAELDQMPGVRGRILGYCRRGSSAFVALSAEIAASLRSDPRLAGEVFQVSNGVDTSLLRPADPQRREAARRARNISEQTFAIVAVGALLTRKNPLGLIRGVTRVRYRPVHLFLAGPPFDLEYSKRVEEAAATVPDGVQVDLVGRVTGEQVAELLAMADSLALFSRSEGLPNSLLEGMASGLPCVATDVPGSRDVLAGGGGILVPPDDEAALAEALEAFANDRESAKRLGQEARRIIERDYSLPRIARRYREIYTHLIGKRASDPR
jgi:glycosyltransferase involved in cell wall biosynthesis